MLTLGATPLGAKPGSGLGSAKVTVTGGTPPYTGGIAGGCTGLSSLSGASPTFLLSMDPSLAGGGTFAGGACTVSFSDATGASVPLSITLAPALSYTLPSPAPSTSPGLNFSSSIQSRNLTVTGGTGSYTVGGNTSVYVYPSPSPTTGGYVYPFSANVGNGSVAPVTITDALGESISVPTTVYQSIASAVNLDGTTTSAIFANNTMNNFVTGVFPPDLTSIGSPLVRFQGNTFGAPVPTVGSFGSTCGSTPISRSLPSSGATSTPYGTVFTFQQPFIITGTGTCKLAFTDPLGVTFTYNVVILGLTSSLPLAAAATGGQAFIDSLNDGSGRTIGFGALGVSATFQIVGNGGGLVCATTTGLNNVTTIATAGTPVGSCFGSSVPSGSNGFTVTSQGAGLASYVFSDANSGAKVTVNFGVTTLGLNVSDRKRNAKT